MSGWGWVFVSIGGFVLGTAAYAGLSAAPWVPTRKRERELLLSGLERTGTEMIFDLGAGTGTMLFALRNAGHTGPLIGYEISFGPWLYSIIRKWSRPGHYRNISFRYQSLYQADVTSADIILLFLLPDAYPKLKPLLDHVPHGTRVVTEAWEIPGLSSTMLKAQKTLPWHIHLL